MSDERRGSRETFSFKNIKIPEAYRSLIYMSLIHTLFRALAVVATSLPNQLPTTPRSQVIWYKETGDLSDLEHLSLARCLRRLHARYRPCATEAPRSQGRVQQGQALGLA